MINIKDLIKPEFFDTFGLPIFSIILIISIMQLINKNKLSNWVWILLIIFSILGLLVDGSIIAYMVTIKNMVI